MRISPILIGVASASLAVSVAGQGQRSADARLISPEEKAWFSRQSQASKEKIIVELRAAQACIADYTARDGVKDGEVTAKLPQPRFYSGISNGYVVYRTVPGIKGCSPAFSFQTQEKSFTELPEAYFGPPRTMRLQELCAVTAANYAAAFNRTLAMLRPDAFREACPAGQLEAK